MSIAESLGLLTRQEICALFNIEPVTEANRRCKGSMPPHVKLGSEIYYKRDAVEVWIERHSRAADAPRGPGRPRKGTV